MQQILRVESKEILEQFLFWVSQFDARECKLVTLEGLPHAGKSTLLSFLPADQFATVELDRFIHRKADPNHTWAESIPIAEARERIQELLRGSKILVVEGPAVWELSKNLFADVPFSKIKRVYIKQMSRTGTYVDWLAGGILLDGHLHRSPYFRSIFQHHSSEPWNEADLIIERLPEDDPE
ncbi:hypothetical protein [Hyphomonas sp.]|uniref:hypothetical protein n=1 Tax=Hyphomonas sp. TaxID=87 RepID=UPI003528FA22